MPIYNGVEFLLESVPSILNQTVPTNQWELLIGVNGHPPNSAIYQHICEQFSATIYKNIRVFDYHDCKGKSTTLNKLLGECSYDYVALLDVDDIWLPTKLATQLPFVAQEYDVVGTKCIYFGDMNGHVPAIPTQDISHVNFLEGNPVINSSAIIHKSLAYWDQQHDGIEDYDLWLRLWKQQKRFYNCPEVLVKHRIHHTSAFNSKGNHNHVAELQQKYM